MITISRLKKWLDTLDSKGQIAIDDGGLSLVEMTPDGEEETGAYYEVGGADTLDEEDDE